MSDGNESWRTAPIKPFSRAAVTSNPTPGLVMVYSRLHAQLPSAVPITGATVSFGREPDNDLCIPEAAVSRFHGRIEHRQDGCWVVDGGSTNGVLVNGTRVDTHRLQDHDLIRVGDTLLRFAARGIFSYGAYRPDGSVVEAARQMRHPLRGGLLIGGAQIDQLLESVWKVAKTGLSVVITGESGTGKELVARTFHEASARPGRFQAINCAALPANLIESELFGYRRGAFTGANQDKTGLVMAADEGTLFLDEIGDMPLEAQAKLLRVLQERTVLPIGATSPQPVDVRVVCATHRNLDEAVARGTFRGDLFARLGEFVARLPPLRERREDLYSLVRHFLHKAGRPELSTSLAFMVGVVHYHWPYNVRELESAVRLAVALSDGQAELDLVHLPDAVRGALDGHGEAASLDVSAVSPTAPTYAASRRERSRAPTEAELRVALERHRGNIAAVGREYGKERMQVHRWLKRYGIDVSEYRA